MNNAPHHSRAQVHTHLMHTYFFYNTISLLVQYICITFIMSFKNFTSAAETAFVSRSGNDDVNSFRKCPNSYATQRMVLQGLIMNRMRT
jgi:hypothetical protein